MQEMLTIPARRTCIICSHSSLLNNYKRVSGVGARPSDSMYSTQMREKDQSVIHRRSRPSTLASRRQLFGSKHRFLPIRSMLPSLAPRSSIPLQGWKREMGWAYGWHKIRVVNSCSLWRLVLLLSIRETATSCGSETAILIRTIVQLTDICNNFIPDGCSRSENSGFSESLVVDLSFSNIHLLNTCSRLSWFVFGL